MIIYDQTVEEKKETAVILPFALESMEQDIDEYDPKILGALAFIFLLVGVFSACVYVWAIRA
jgi:hypothetical protein